MFRNLLSQKTIHYVCDMIISLIFILVTQYGIEKKVDEDEEDEDDEDDDEFGASKKNEEAVDDPVLRKYWALQHDDMTHF